MPWPSDIPVLLEARRFNLVATFQPFGANFGPDQDQRINRLPAEMLAMEAPGSSQLIDRVEPETEPGAVLLARGLRQLGVVNPASPGWVGGPGIGAVGG